MVKHSKHRLGIGRTWIMSSAWRLIKSKIAQRHSKEVSFKHFTQKDVMQPWNEKFKLLLHKVGHWLQILGQTSRIQICKKIRKVQMKKISDLWKAVWLALRVACLFQPDVKQPANNMARSPNVIVNTEHYFMLVFSWKKPSGFAAAVIGFWGTLLPTPPKLKQNHP